MRIRAVILRTLRQFRRDKRTVALMFIAPLLVLTLMNLVFNGSAYVPRIGMASSGSTSVSQEALAGQLEAQNAEVLQYPSNDLAEKALEDHKLDALVSVQENRLAIRLEGSDPTANRAVMTVIQKMTTAQPPAQPPSSEGTENLRFSPEISYLHGSEDMSTIDHIGPVLIGFFIFFFVFLIAGVAFLRERTSGTLERLLASPIRRSEIVLGYLGGFGLFTLAQALLITWYSIKVLGIEMAGSFGLVLLLTLLLSMTALTLGILLSAYASNELQMIQFIPLIIVPQLFLSGLFNLDTLPGWLAALRFIMPLYYGSQAMTDVMIRGQGWNGIAVNLVVLIGFCLLFTLLNVAALRKHRKI
ncbi:ABC transporter permease [Paenibacillus yonginensis]|uniref:ABC transporter permease n=1 Tax=Paenibacillus yonginensis TaxID=1462996 RepID=A0A1B1N285_9BACL|nr:ABC transporter permease [Paenibacillus yonginensis]ANS75540.1 ABC transporter permease [Paenibacillus yonginensis]